MEKITLTHEAPHQRIFQYTSKVDLESQESFLSDVNLASHSGEILEERVHALHWTLDLSSIEGPCMTA